MHPVSTLTSILVLSAIFGAGCRYTRTIASEDTENGTADTDTGTANTDTETANTDTETADTNTGTDDTDSATGSEVHCDVPTDFQWTSSSHIIDPPEGALSIKEPTVVYYEDEKRWLIYASVRPYPYWDMSYLSVADWYSAGEEVQTSASTNPELAVYKISPQLFYFAPGELWYLVYQVPEPAYSTTEDPTDVGSWSAATQFMPMPDNLKDPDYVGIDYWVICDDTDCYLFFTDLNGTLYRSRTPIESFPNGFEGNTEIVMTDDNPYAVFQGVNVYKMAGTDKYLLLVNALGDNVGRYMRAWTADRLDGEWTPLAATEDTSFASINNVSGAAWALDGINSGEMLRTNPDQTMTIDTCTLQFLYHGLTLEGEDNGHNEYSLGLLTDAR